MEAIDIHKNHKKRRFSPTRRIAFSFFMVIFIGAYLLSLPICNNGITIPFVDHLFTATSATCVTGLVTKTVSEQYSVYGQIVIIVLIQIGGLGFLTLLNMMLVLLKKKLSFTNKIIMQEALNQNSLADIAKYIRRVIKYTFFFEFVGAVLLCFVFIPEFGVGKGIYYGIFHSISAFCNAGFDILGSQSLVGYQKDILVNFVICGLIIAGGLGFIVWVDLRLAWDHYKENFKVFRVRKFVTSLTFHTRIVLIMTGLLLISGTGVILALEWNNPATLGTLSWPYKILASFFQSTTLRTAGFATVDIASLYDPTKLVMCCFMFIGGSPAGTAGGIKTVTFAIILLYIHMTARGSTHIHLMKRSLSDHVVKRALSVALISFFIVLGGLVILSVSENKEFIDLMFEAYSAFATVGLTAGVTSGLSVIGKFVIMVLMYIGRIGPITMVLIFAKQYSERKGKDIQYPVSDVLIG